MTTLTLLTLLTIVLVLLLVAVLVIGLVKIIQALESIGGSSRGYTARPSLLSKARWGVRAIEKQTAAIGPEVTKLNNGLEALDETLSTLADRFGGLLETVERQGGPDRTGGNR